MRTSDAFLDGKKTECKWVNDMDVDGRKTAGVLIKQEIMAGGSNQAVVQVGIGVNLKVSPSQEFTCLEKEAGKDISADLYRDALV